MATPRTATVLANDALSGRARSVRLRLDAGEAMEVTGGQYVIVNTGVAGPQGKPIKRTYSLAAWDAEAAEFELVVLPLRGGVGSSYVAGLRAGETLTFSGPWGKKPAPPEEGDVVLVGTDTGLTTLCGWASHPDRAHLKGRTRALWLHHAADGFCSEAWARARVEPHVASFCVAPLPPVVAPERIDIALDHLESALSGVALGPSTYVVLSGDGRLLRAMASRLRDLGVVDEQLVLETFFNKPPKDAG